MDGARDRNIEKVACGWIGPHLSNGSVVSVPLPFKERDGVRHHARKATTYCSIRCAARRGACDKTFTFNYRFLGHNFLSPSLPGFLDISTTLRTKTLSHTCEFSGYGNARKNKQETEHPTRMGLLYKTNEMPLSLALEGGKNRASLFPLILEFDARLRMRFQK